MTITCSQLYQKGDLVHIDEVLPSSMSHFTAGVDAIIIESSEDSCGRSSNTEAIYGLYLEHQGYSAWYHEGQLTLRTRNRLDILKKWEAAREVIAKQREPAKPIREDICQRCDTQGPTSTILFYWWRMRVCKECENLARENGHIE